MTTAKWFSRGRRFKRSEARELPSRRCSAKTRSLEQNQSRIPAAFKSDAGSTVYGGGAYGLRDIQGSLSTAEQEFCAHRNETAYYGRSYN